MPEVQAAGGWITPAAGGKNQRVTAILGVLAQLGDDHTDRFDTVTVGARGLVLRDNGFDLPLSFVPDLEKQPILVRFIKDRRDGYK